MNDKPKKNMNHTKNLLLLALCLFCMQCSVSKMGSQISVSETAELVKTLSSDAFEGREPGTPGMEKTVNYIERYLQTAGIKPYFDGTYKDTVNIFNRESYNLVGVIKAAVPSDEFILIGAHMDHLGKTTYGEDSVYNGANDNASGVATVLRMANELAKHKLKKNVLVALFTEEESGLNGSELLAKRLKAQSINLVYVLNYDMVGTRLNNKPGIVYITGYNRSNLVQVANKLLGEEFIVHDSIDDEMGVFRLSDNYPFYQTFNIPSHSFLTFNLKTTHNYTR
jgi:bacterial leucyl aminopeptidase